MPPRLIRQVIRRYRNKVHECRLKALVSTQGDLADLTRINRTTISALENNRLFLSAAYALVIAEALHCRLDDLYECIADKPPLARKDASDA